MAAKVQRVARLRFTTARLSPGARGPDLLDITRKGANALSNKGLLAPWAFLAPSIGLLHEALKMRAVAAQVRKKAEEQGGLFGSPGVAEELRQQAERLEAEAWAFYEPRFIQELRDRYKADASPWNALLGRERAVLACFCPDARRCHRTLVARALVKLGATYEGELRLAG